MIKNTAEDSTDCDHTDQISNISSSPGLQSLLLLIYKSEVSELDTSITSTQRKPPGFLVSPSPARLTMRGPGPTPTGVQLGV